jgi:type III secretion system low calcium response chaperone LcrH/SycD
MGAADAETLELTPMGGHRQARYLDARDVSDLAQEIADFLFAGGTVADIYGLDATQIEAVYALGYNLYNQGRWAQALQVFSFLTFHDHVDRRLHIARAACLQMLKRYEEALTAYLLAHVLDVSDPAVGLQLAECLIALRRKPEARAALETVAVLAGEDPAFAPIRARAAAQSEFIGR